MRKIIPEKTEITCDICKNLFSKDEVLVQYVISISGNFVENGLPTGPALGTGKYDVCSSCMGRVFEALRI